MRRLQLLKYMSFGSHQSQAIECIKALYDQQIRQRLIGFPFQVYLAIF